MKQKKMLKKMRTSNKNYNGCLYVCVCEKVLTVLTRERGWEVKDRAGACGCLVWAPPPPKKKEEPKAPRSTKSVVPCAILFIYFSCILFFALCTHIDTLIHTHTRAEQANFIFIFIISLRHINKSHGHDGEKLKMILNN